LLKQDGDKWEYIAKGRMPKSVTIPPASKRGFRTSLCARKIKSRSGWAYTSASTYKIRLDVYGRNRKFIRKIESTFHVSGNILWHLNDGLVVIHLD